MSIRLLPPEEFARAVLESASKVQLIAKGAAAAVFTEVATHVKELTPVLTGRARANWIPTVGAPTGRTTDDVAGVTTTGEPLTGDERGEIDAAVQQFLKDPAATRLTLENNLSYIGALNDGTSEKAPAGIVEPAIAATLAVIKDRGVK